MDSMKTFITFLNVLLLANMVIAEHPMSFQFKTSLYEPTDHVTVLNVTNFYDTLIGRDHAWLLQLYSSYCGHCMKFAPHFKAFVRGMAGEFTFNMC